MKKAQYFVTCGELPFRTVNEMHPDLVRKVLTQKKKRKSEEGQLSLFFPDGACGESAQAGSMGVRDAGSGPILLAAGNTMTAAQVALGSNDTLLLR